jgi:hypothetical protein
MMEAALAGPQQGQLDTRAIEVASKALTTAELAADGIGNLRDDLRAISTRNDSQHAENKAAMETGFQMLHARISNEKDARQSTALRVMIAIAGGLFLFALYLLVNDSPFVRRADAPDITIQQRNTP